MDAHFVGKGRYEEALGIAFDKDDAASNNSSPRVTSM
jgi:hypothetical protein